MDRAAYDALVISELRRAFVEKLHQEGRFISFSLSWHEEYPVEVDNE